MEIFPGMNSSNFGWSKLFVLKCLSFQLFMLPSNIIKNIEENFFSEKFLNIVYFNYYCYSFFFNNSMMSPVTYLVSSLLNPRPPTDYDRSNCQ